ncbi:MAG: TolC family protein [Hydrogenophilales bacterium]|nr:TolC family protein [Hydrogenophilales bacterium]
MSCKIFSLASAGIFLVGALAVGASADTAAWTLESAARRVLEVAPETRAADAEVAAREGALKQAGAWPNPSIGLRADQKLGVEDGGGGTDLTQVAITQPLPLTRLASQRRQAEGQLAAARERLRHARLVRETEAARAFHALQLAEARLNLAGQRVAFVEGLESATARRRDRVVRYLTPLERARLAILREAAEQEAASAEGKYSEAAAQFRALLAIGPEATPQTTPLAPASPPPPLDELLKGLDAHPALVANDQDIEAARAGIDVARASRFADPTLGVFRERDFLNGARRDYNGVMLSVQVPLWNLNSGGVARAQAETDQARERRTIVRRDLDARLRQGRLHLGHLIEQAERYRERLLGPARQMLDLARRGFETGEQNILALLDGYNTYFDAEVRYRELLQEAWQEAAELRLAAGVALIQPENTP